MRYRVLIYAGLAFVVSMPAEAQKLQMALAAAADFTPVYPFGKIPTNIKGIVAIAELGKEKPKELVASYFKVGDNPGIGDEKVAEQKQAVGDSPRVVLPYTAPGDWTPWKYRLDVSADGRPWRSAEWEVVPLLPPAILRSAGDIMPLRAGRSWPMVFTSWSSPEVKVTLPGAERDRKGVYRMSASITFPGVEQHGVHVRHMRDGKLAEEELWQVGGSGIAVIGRLAGAKRAPRRSAVTDHPVPVAGAGEELGLASGRGGSVEVPGLGTGSPRWPEWRAARLRYRDGAIDDGSNNDPRARYYPRAWHQP